MSKLLNIMLVLLGAMSLAACLQQEKADSKAYYMQHPRLLSEAVATCRAANVTEQSSVHCQMVIEAAEAIMPLIEAHQRNPQAFGQRVLDAEMAYARTGQNEDEVKTLLAIVGLSSPE